LTLPLVAPAIRRATGLQPAPVSGNAAGNDNLAVGEKR